MVARSKVFRFEQNQVSWKTSQQVYGLFLSPRAPDGEPLLTEPRHAVADETRRITSGYFGLWHHPDRAARPPKVGCQGKSGREMLAADILFVT
jgi:hypothetical protein